MREESHDERTLTFISVAGITVVALALRLIDAQQSLSGDELFTYAEVTPSSLAHVFDQMDLWENSPPVYFLFAWLSGKLGDPTTLIRLPSVVAGAATVPVVYFLGDAIAGRRSGIIAAALVAVMPMAVFYGGEARPYGLLLFLTTLSTLALLRALESKGRFGWWLLYWVACVLALYTHYVAGIAIAVEAAWALLTQQGRRRAVLTANAAVAVAFLPWFPMLDNNTRLLNVYNLLQPLTWKNILTDPLRLIFGHPFAAFDQVPGLVSIVVACLAAATIAVGLLRPSLLQGVGMLGPAVVRGASADRYWRAGGSIDVRRVGWLLVSLTAGVVAVTLAYSVVSDATIYAPNHMVTVVPYFCLLVGIAAAALQRRLALIVASALVLAALVGSLRMLVDYPRPDRRAAAEAIAERAAPGTPVVEAWFHGYDTHRFDPLQQDLAIYLDDGFRLSQVADANDWPKGRDVYAVTTGSLRSAQVAAAAQSAGAHLVETLSFDGLQEVTVGRYSGVGPAGGSGSVADRRRGFRAYLRQHPAARERFRRELRAYFEQHPAAEERFRGAIQAR